jgi:hypothetical protein
MPNKSKRSRKLASWWEVNNEASHIISTAKADPTDTLERTPSPSVGAFAAVRRALAPLLSGGLSRASRAAQKELKCNLDAVELVHTECTEVLFNAQQTEGEEEEVPVPCLTEKQEKTLKIIEEVDAQRLECGGSMLSPYLVRARLTQNRVHEAARLKKQLYVAEERLASWKTRCGLAESSVANKKLNAKRTKKRAKAKADDPVQQQKVARKYIKRAVYDSDGRTQVFRDAWVDFASSCRSIRSATVGATVLLTSWTVPTGTCGTSCGICGSCSGQQTRTGWSGARQPRS